MSGPAVRPLRQTVIVNGRDLAEDMQTIRDALAVGAERNGDRESVPFERVLARLDWWLDRLRAGDDEEA